MIRFSNGRFQFWEDILLDSIERFASSSISEIIIVYTSEPQPRPRTHVGHIPIHRVVAKPPLGATGHANGLHAAIEKSTSEYIMFCDPDAFFFSDVPKFFVEALNKLDLFIVGINHHMPLHQAYEEFPCVINMLMRRDKLPPKGWLSNSIFWRYPGLLVDDLSQPSVPMPDLWLMFGPPVNRWQEFPKTNGLYDVGCNLWLWNKENNGRWLSFGASVINNHARLYVANNYHTNFSFTSPWSQRLLYHKTANGEDNDFIEEYLRL